MFTLKFKYKYTHNVIGHCSVNRSETTLNCKEKENYDSQSNKIERYSSHLIFFMEFHNGNHKQREI